MSSNNFSLPGLRHTYQTANLSRVHPGRVVAGSPAGMGELGGSVYGTGLNGPHGWFPTEDYLDDFLTYYKPVDGTVSDGSASADGTQTWFWTLNSGTVALGSTVAGFLGMPIATTAASSTAVTQIATAAFLSTANAAANGGKWAGMTVRVNLPNPTTANYGLYFGFGNKQAAPQTTQFTDGTWIELVTAASLQFNGRVRKSSGSASTTALTGFLQPAAAARSWDLGVVMIGQTKNIFFIRDASATTPANSGNWFPISPATDTIWPSNAVTLRPHLAFVATGTSVAMSYEAPKFFIEKDLNY
jgi:hypothetical protein